VREAASIGPAAYDEEKADALRKLAALIESIVNPPEGNVVTLRGVR
jgi:hypothetical protein